MRLFVSASEDEGGDIQAYRVRQYVLLDLFLQRPDTLTVMVLFRGRVEAASACIPRDLPRALERLAAQIMP